MVICIKEPTINSIFANVFAGLITGFYVYLITSIRNITSYSLNNKIKWLEELHKESLSFLKMHKEIMKKRLF